MANIDKAGFDAASRTPPKSGLLSSLGGSQFIAAQFFTIIATILGVYLAGYVGFQRTLEYDSFVKAQEQASLIQSISAELSHNTSRLREFVPKMEKTQEGIPVYGDWPRLRLFLWQAAGQNPSVFAAPAQSLADLQAFYEDIGEMLNDAAAKENFRRLTTSNVYDRKVFTEEFDKKLQSAETALLPALQSAVAEAQVLVSKYSSVK